jgi:hypothetical protein
VCSYVGFLCSGGGGSGAMALCLHDVLAVIVVTATMLCRLAFRVTGAVWP